MIHYKRGINLIEETVNEILGEGYTLHSVTSVNKTTPYSNSQYSDLIYHFTKCYYTSIDYATGVPDYTNISDITEEIINHKMDLN